MTAAYDDAVARIRARQETERIKAAWLTALVDAGNVDGTVPDDVATRLADQAHRLLNPKQP